jgi:hypothetical protein
VHIGLGWGDLRGKDHLKEAGLNGSVILKWIFKKWDGGMAQDRDIWRAVVNAVMNLRVQYNTGNFLTI